MVDLRLHGELRHGRLDVGGVEGACPISADLQ